MCSAGGAPHDRANVGLNKGLQVSRSRVQRSNDPKVIGHAGLRLAARRVLAKATRIVMRHEL
jgi:hypothetical protein